MAKRWSVRAKSLKKTCPQAELIYALGGGWGHLTRAVAFAKTAPQASIRILTNSPFAAQVQSVFPDLDLVVLNSDLPIQTAREQAVKAIAAFAPGCLIVDTFPRGLGGELVGVLDSFVGTKVLVHRDLNPRYVAENNLCTFVNDKYDLILIPGKSEGRAFAKLQKAVVTDPWLIRNADELPSPSQARQLLKIENDGYPCILICASGTAQELSWFDAVVLELVAHHPRAAIRCVAPTRPPNCPIEYWIKYWPAADLLPAANVVVGGAGYNTVHECLACNVPLVARPWPRLYDRQWQRAKRAGVTIVDQPDQAASAAIHRVNIRSRISEITFLNGALVARRLVSAASTLV
jgi:hypothetical protein